MSEFAVLVSSWGSFAARTGSSRPGRKIDLYNINCNDPEYIEVSHLKWSLFSSHSLQCSMSSALVEMTGSV